MPSTLSRKDEQVIENMVRIAGSEQAFEIALATLNRNLGHSPSATELLRHLLKKRLSELQAMHGAAAGM